MGRGGQSKTVVVRARRPKTSGLVWIFDFGDEQNIRCCLFHSLADFENTLLLCHQRGSSNLGYDLNGTLYLGIEEE